ncbi:MAG: zinc metallopeptidase [Nitratireductor sp.]|nr:zinc metallopeptidase [Nitratireductor sp.]
MRWQGRRQSDNVRDIRGQGRGGFPGGMGFPGGGGGPVRIPIPMGGPRTSSGGGLGCGTLIVIGVILWMLGINPLAILSGGQIQMPSPAPEMPRIDRAPSGGQVTRSNDEKRQFVSTILASTEQVWSGIFESYGRDYPAPELVLFSGGVNSACGMASAASGPFYCPGDRKVYIDLSFYDQLEREFQAGGDFAQAYVLAHEVGHHVQNLIGILPQFNRMRQSMGKLEVNQMSVQVELQADCLAGVWGHYVQKEGWLERGDLEEAINAAEQIGDDTIQRRTQGYVVPDAFNHGTSEQRKAWFARGFDAGRIEACDTFSAGR